MVFACFCVHLGALDVCTYGQRPQRIISIDHLHTKGIKKGTLTRVPLTTNWAAQASSRWELMTPVGGTGWNDSVLQWKHGPL